jgi:hypothetical protein
MSSSTRALLWSCLILCLAGARALGLGAPWDHLAGALGSGSCNVLAYEGNADDAAAPHGAMPLGCPGFLQENLERAGEALLRWPEFAAGVAGQRVWRAMNRGPPMSGLMSC